jgi:hypothetical protein
MMAELPPDPFLHGSAGEQLVQDGMLLAQQLLNIASPDALMDALFALEERDLRATAIVLLILAHPAFPGWIRAVAVRGA